MKLKCAVQKPPRNLKFAVAIDRLPERLYVEQFHVSSSRRPARQAASVLARNRCPAALLSPPWSPVFERGDQCVRVKPLRSNDVEIPPRGQPAPDRRWQMARAYPLGLARASGV